MFGNEDPFGFASSELLTKVFHAEIKIVTELLARHPDFRNLLDAPEATIPQRTACFTLLAHRELVSMIDDKFVARLEKSPSLDDTESNTLKSSYGLVAADAPAWVEEMQKVVEQLPAHFYTSLPEALRMGGYNPDNAEQMEAIRSASQTLGSVEQIQALTEGVINQQLQRLLRRWSATTPSTDASQQSAASKIKRPKGFEGLGRKKANYSRYMDGLTEKQQQIFSLRYEYRLTVTEIASRLGIDRSTVYEHIAAIDKKVREMGSSEKRESSRAKLGSDE